MSVKKLSMSIGFIMILSGFLAACQNATASTAPPATGLGVGITDKLCPTVEIQVGEQVTWTNEGSHEHMVHHTPSDGESQFDSGILQPEDNFIFTFIKAGRYPYACSADGAATGRITVQP